MKTIICPECNARYDYEPNPNYPDKRKYCANCSEKKKAEWDAKPVGVPEPSVDVSKTAAKEYHLSQEKVNARALEAAINCSNHEQMQDTNALLELANVYVKYIMGNGYA